MKWFEVQAAADGRHADVWINDQIGIDWWSGDGTTASAFINAIASLGDVETLTVHINSPGGDVADGIAIANYLRGHKAQVTTRVEGIAASIAATIAMGGDRREMATGSLLMIHDPWTVAMGNATEMRKLADDLDTIRNGILELFVARAGEPRRVEIQEAMRAETWMTGEDAMALGLIDAVDTDLKAAASIGDYSRALAAAGRSAQHHLEQQRAPSQPAPAPSAMSAADALALAFDIEPAQAEARAAELGDQILAWRDKPATSPAPDTAALQREAVAAERERVVAIIDTCTTTGQHQLLAKLVASDMQTDTAREYVFDVAAASSAGVHSSHSPEGGQRAGIDTQGIYARRRARSAS